MGKIFGQPGETNYYCALEGINLLVTKGEFLCLLGPSGCGKTTLLNILAGFEKPTSGRVLLSGREIKSPGSDRVMIFQDPNMALFPWLDTQENVEFGMRLKGTAEKECRERVSHYLKMVGLLDHRGKFPHELSGGMKQRVQIARALAIEPEILLMDEPFASLDTITRMHLHNELLQIWETTGKTIVFVTHDITESVFLADRVAVMSLGPCSSISHLFQINLQRRRDPCATNFSQFVEQIRERIEGGTKRIEPWG